MKASSLIQVLCAAHWSYRVVPDPFHRRGGIMIVAPGGHGKSTILSRMSEELPKMLALSDLTTRQAVSLRSSIVEGKYRTLVIDEMEKLYQRMDSTSANVEGTLQALIEQGFHDAPGERPTEDVMRAQCLVIANMTEDFYVRKSRNWAEAFMRRWIVCKFRLENPDVFADAIEKWKRVEIRDGMLFMMPMEDIPYSVRPDEARIMRHWLQVANRDDKTPQQLLHKILSVLRWRHAKSGVKDKSFEIMEDFSSSLGRGGCEMVL